MRTSRNVPQLPVSVRQTALRTTSTRPVLHSQQVSRWVFPHNRYLSYERISFSFLSTNYTMWGFGILNDLMHGREWEESGHFPR